MGRVGETSPGFLLDKDYEKVQALVHLLRLCESKAEVEDALKLVPFLGDYVNLPDDKKSS